MTNISHEEAAIIRTERGLTIACTRKPGQEAIRAQLQAAKAKFKSQP
ncbi:hypothetical protein [Phormidium nigroviride]